MSCNDRAGPPLTLSDIFLFHAILSDRWAKMYVEDIWYVHHRGNNHLWNGVCCRTKYSLVEPHYILVRVISGADTRFGFRGRHEYKKGKGSGDRFLPPPVGPGRSHVLGSFDHQNGKCIIHTKTLKLCIIEYIWRAKRTSELSKIVLERVGVHNPNGIPFAARVHVCWLKS